MAPPREGGGVRTPTPCTQIRLGFSTIPFMVISRGKNGSNNMRTLDFSISKIEKISVKNYSFVIQGEG
jgi:hypothetical protein